LEAYKCEYEKAVEGRGSIRVSFSHKEEFIASFVNFSSNALSFVMPSKRRYRQVRFL
jgi:hypothetical protein